MKDLTTEWVVNKMGQIKTLKTGGNSFYNSVIYKDFSKNKYKYFMVLPVILWYILFCYKPMYGIIIAFKDFSPSLGILESKWVGLKHFYAFFNNINFSRVFGNTIKLSLYNLIFSFPMPILLALFLNEVRNKIFKSTVQTISYFPHFISMVVICGMITQFCSVDGVASKAVSFFTGNSEALLQNAKYFRTIYIVSEIWQGAGFSSIIYFAALCSVNSELYEAAEIDGAGRIKKILHVSIPSIIPTIIILLILKVGQIMSLGGEKVILLYNPLTYDTADIIPSYIYRKGLQEFNWSLSAAVGLFNNIINVICLVAVNSLSKKYSETSLW